MYNVSHVAIGCCMLCNSCYMLHSLSRLATCCHMLQHSRLEEDGGDREGGHGREGEEGGGPPVDPQPRVPARGPPGARRRAEVPLEVGHGQQLHQALREADGREADDGGVGQLLLVPADEGGGGPAPGEELAEQRRGRRAEVARREQHRPVAQQPPARVQDPDLRGPQGRGSHPLQVLL